MSSEQLTQMTCEACKPGAPAATAEQIEEWLTEIPDWALFKSNNIPRLRRTFRFKNFRQALDFTNVVGEIAESEGHHPRLVLEWGKLTVITWTHAIENLHRNDFILAAKIDQAWNERQ